MPCFSFGKKKRKQHREPPPTASQVMGGSNGNTKHSEQRYLVTPTLPSTDSQSLPSGDAAAVSSPSPPSDRAHHQRVTVNDYQKSAVETAVVRRPKPPPLACSGSPRQLSQEILSTPVPLSAHPTSPPHFDEPTPPTTLKLALTKQDSEDYLEPATNSSNSSRRESQQVVTSPSKVSLNEGKRREIINEYFSHRDDIAPNLSQVVPAGVGSVDMEDLPDYTNITLYPDSMPSTIAGSKATQRLSREAVSPLPSPRQESSTPVCKNNSQSSSDSDGTRTGTRRPRPIPRVAGPNSRKTSLTNEGDEQQFDYENVTDVVKQLADSNSSLPRSKPTTPKPVPRIRPVNDSASSVIINSQLLIPTSPSASHTELSRGLVHGEYVHDAQYVTSDAPTVACSEVRPPSPRVDHTGSNDTLPLRGIVDLQARVPRAATHEPGLLSNKKKGYLPMDQSPQTQALINYVNAEADEVLSNTSSRVVGGGGHVVGGGGHVGVGGVLDDLVTTDDGSSGTALDLSYKVPAASQSAVHTAGYLTIIDPFAKPTLPSGPYYNINQQQSYYYNQGLSGHTSSSSPPADVSTSDSGVYADDGIYY